MATKKAAARKYSPAASASVEREMKAMKQGKLKSSSGEKVTNPKQAIAIGLSEARAAGKKVPENPNRPAKKTAGKKAAAKKLSAGKSTAKKSIAKKHTAKKPTAKRSAPMRSMGGEPPMMMPWRPPTGS